LTARAIRAEDKEMELAMLDTEINKAIEEGIVRGTPLDVEQFFKLDILEPGNPGYLEPLVLDGQRDGELLFVYTDRPNGSKIRLKSSGDAGRTWEDDWLVLDGDGNEIEGFHNSVFRLKSGRMGLVYSAYDSNYGHPGRESGLVLVYRTSEDNGRTWSAASRIGTHHACCCTGHGLVLTNGRIVLPSFRWVSPIPGNDAEGWVLSSNEPSPTLSYSFCYVSDDEGKNWKISLSELFVSVNRAAYDMEEPTVVELKDGRLLMHLRSELGRMYRSFSNDQGMSWTQPEAMQIAASYTPHTIRRIPSTGDLLMVWNQGSRQEITTGLHRHRLSCAVSKDDGQTWGNFKNLESLDDVTVVTPPPAWETRAVQPYESYGYYQPQPGLQRYHRAPGILRICYPTIAFVGNEVAIAYDIGCGVLGDGVLGCRLRIIPVEWFTD